jgi:cyanate lyase
MLVQCRPRILRVRAGAGQRPAWKALIEEEFGGGIMSAIDFDMEMERLPDAKGDRVKITMSGKFLPFKYYGATGNAMAYGVKEE